MKPQDLKDLDYEHAKQIAEAFEAMREALASLTHSAEAYMIYHSEKFYSGVEPKPTGLWPRIHEARAALALADKAVTRA